MNRLAIIAGHCVICAVAGVVLCAPGRAADTVTGAAAFEDWHSDAPGLRRLIRPVDLPAAHATPSSSNGATLIPRPKGASPKVPPGFKVDVFASGLDEPRMVRVAPNGDIFVAESNQGRIRILRQGADPSKPEIDKVFADGLNVPFGISFYPPGPDPKFIYVADTDAVVRFPYASGDTEARGKPQPVVPGLPQGGHWTRDIAFTPDGKTMYLTIGSGSNDAEGLERKTADEAAEYDKLHGLGAAWGREERRADVLAFDSEGGHEYTVATGLRNCVSLAIQPGTDTIWCATNERDGLGDNLPPDYVTRVKDDAFYGWPWYYIGANQDPNHRGERPDLAFKVTVPDVLIQPHSAPLGMSFYTGTQFPPEYRGQAFVALQGSWNRAKRTGSKVVIVILKDGVPTGEYEDFMIGLIASDTEVWGHPVATATAKDGSLLVTDEVGGVVWRISYGK